MMNNLDEILQNAKSEIANISSRAGFDNVKAKFFGANGTFRELMKSLAVLPKEEKPAAGSAINACKTEIEGFFNTKLAYLEARDLESSLGCAIDPSLNVSGDVEIFSHPLTKIRNRVIEIFSKLGFTIADGTEIETEWFCFDALNTQQSHPSRDDRDTFYFEDDAVVENVTKRASERYVLRSHTSTVQVRTMLKTNPPIRILSPGTVFRKDAIDATHSPNFRQLEGLVVEEGITVCDLKGTLDFFFKELIGENCEIRMRPSYFPFVSPGFEVDLMSKNLLKLSGRWIEIGGCGMVAPNVLKNCEIDSNLTGFAFGMGIERLAMLLYGVDDIRLFYQNDTRFLKQFKSSMM